MEAQYGGGEEMGIVYSNCAFGVVASDGSAIATEKYDSNRYRQEDLALMIAFEVHITTLLRLYRKLELQMSV